MALFGEANVAKRPEVRKLISESKMGDKNPMKRPEVANKVSESLIEYYKNNASHKKGVPCPESQKKDISIALTGRKQTLESNLKRSKTLKGRKRKQKTKDRISKSSLGKKMSKTACQNMSKSQIIYFSDIENRIKMSCAKQGISRDEWVDFVSQEPYCSIWTKEFKEFIKERDNYECQNPDCWKISKRLCGHHIDYNKKNCNPWNIITICLSCNARANFKRDKWQKFYEDIMENRNG